MESLTERFASKVFDDRIMKATLPAKVYQSLKKTIDLGETIDASVADAVALAMKDWAIKNGATHFTHWFQPLTGVTAEKHDSFISPAPDGRIIMEFSGKELIKGEPDASSFPSGGIRATFEARGYTAWDPTSFAFIKDKTLCIPTAFCSYGGEALDKKTPLLRSMSALSKQAVRILRLFGDNTVKRVNSMVGPEQEYFLIDKSLYEKREDLILTGRTLFGATPPKGQELDDHYFGAIKPRVAEFMNDLNEELWSLGVLAKTEHNEVAPSQHELAPIYSVTNVAADHNQLTMEIMKKVALRHGFVCLLHEKPFAGVNGSGKHNNWSMATDSGVNLLSTGDTPSENARFLLFLCAVIKAVDEYQDLLRLSVASAGNDHRLGANEAPPAVVSIFLGDELNAILESIKADEVYGGTKKKVLSLGVDALPAFTRDTTDRNRTSPFAFTGNKFEFRMLGSNDSISCANVMINSAVASTLAKFADRLEAAADFGKELNALIKETIVKNGRIVFNGNGYDNAWIEEAKRRGLCNLPSTPDCVPCLIAEKNVDMLTSLGVYTKTELYSRYEILLENYKKTVLIEASVMADMATKQILPATEKFATALASGIAAKKMVAPTLKCSYACATIDEIAALSDEIYALTNELKAAIDKAKAIEDIGKAARFVRDEVIAKMDELRKVADRAESITAEEFWPFPTYAKLLFGEN